MRLLGLLVPALALSTTLAMAQTLEMAPGDPAAAAAATPTRGATMSVVEARFGSPTTRHAAIGAPPITRWDYPGFSVFFEHDRVLHSVLVRSAGN